MKPAVQRSLILECPDGAGAAGLLNADGRPACDLLNVGALADAGLAKGELISPLLTQLRAVEAAGLLKIHNVAVGRLCGGHAVARRGGRRPVHARGRSRQC